MSCFHFSLHWINHCDIIAFPACFRLSRRSAESAVFHLFNCSGRSNKLRLLGALVFNVRDPLSLHFLTVLYVEINLQVRARKIVTLIVHIFVIMIVHSQFGRYRVIRCCVKCVMTCRLLQWSHAQVKPLQSGHTMHIVCEILRKSYQLNWRSTWRWRQKWRIRDNPSTRRTLSLEIT